VDDWLRRKVANTTPQSSYANGGRTRILSVLGCLGVAVCGLTRPDSIIAQTSCSESPPPTDDMLAINCIFDASRSDDRRVGDVAASACKHSATQ